MAVDTLVPTSWKLSLFWATVDGSKAGNLTESQPALLTGHSFATGLAAFNRPVAIGTVVEAKVAFGEGSMLERMVNTFLKGNTTQQLWCLPIPEPAAGTAATGSMVATVSVGASGGVLNLYVAGQKVALTVYPTDTAANVATNVVAAINAMKTLPVTAAVDGVTPGKINLTTRWKGISGNDIDIRLNYLGTYGGEVMPTGLALTVPDLVNGAGVPDFTAGIAAIQTATYVHVGMPFNDTASLSVWDAEYGFRSGGRWHFARQQYGWLYNALRYDYADAITWGLAHNSSVTSTMHIEPDVPSPLWEVTAAYCAQGSAALLDDAARPLQTLPLVGILPAPVDLRLTQTELNDLANAGLAVQHTGPDGLPIILREVLQYQLNSFGQADTAFSVVTVLSNLAELLNRMRSTVTSKWPRHKLAPDGARFGAGQAIVTPAIVKAELVVEARQAEYDGLLANVAAFKANLIVEIDDNDANRLNVLYPPQIMGQLRSFDVLAQFRLQYPDASLLS